MKFLLDESADARLIHHLRGLGHDATRVGSDYLPGIPDADVLEISRAEDRILITDDRDFGELVFRHGHPHAGVIYLRLGDYADLSTKIERLDDVLSRYTQHLTEFVVVTASSVRVRPRTR